MQNKNELSLRIGVGVILLNKENKIFVGKRIDNPLNYWQMPQGGIDQNENFLDAAKRELVEETSVKNTELIKELDGWFIYDLPKNLIDKIWQGRYRGQKQKWFVMRFIGKDNEININTKNPEFLEWKWINAKDLINVVIDFKRKIYKKLTQELTSLQIN